MGYPVYQLKVTLEDIRPPIWRRILVPAEITLGDLHRILQTIMGWDNSHLHAFKIQNLYYSDPFQVEMDKFTKDEEKIRLNQFIVREGQRFKYKYDFGDNWEHRIEVEKIIFQDTPLEHPICLKGKRACPPEDIGGIWGYTDFLEAIEDPYHPRHALYSEWYEGEFDPEAFDLDKVNEQLGKLSFGGGRTFPKFSVFIENPELVTDYWETALNPEVEAIAQNLNLRRYVIEMLTYFQNHAVVGTKKNELPLKIVKELLRKFILIAKGEIPAELEEELQKIRKPKVITSVNFCHILISSGNLASGGPNERWTITPLGEQFLNAPPFAQVWYLFLTWWLNANWPDVAPDSALRALFTSFDREIAWAFLENLLLKSQETIEYSEFTESFSFELDLTDLSSQEKSVIQNSLNLAIWHIILMPLRHFKVIEFFEPPTVDQEKNLFQIHAFKMNPIQRDLLDSFMLYLEDIIDDFEEDLEDDFGDDLDLADFADRDLKS